MSPAEARRQAALKLGAAEAIREHHHAEQSLPFIENLLFDLRYAVRMLLRSPGFSFIAIATMALGIGATTAIYSVIDATLLHPLPYPNPAELVRIEDDLPGVGAQDVGISVPEWRDLAEFRDIPVRVDFRHRRRREPHRQCTARASQLQACYAELLRGPRCRRAVGPHIRSARCHSRLQPGGRDQRRALEEGIRSRPAHSRQSSAPGQRRLSRRGRHAARFSRSGLNQRGAEYGTVAGEPAWPVCRFRPRCAVHVCRVERSRA